VYSDTRLDVTINKAANTKDTPKEPVFVPRLIVVLF